MLKALTQVKGGGVALVVGLTKEMLDGVAEGHRIREARAEERNRRVWVAE